MRGERDVGPAWPNRAFPRALIVLAFVVWASAVATGADKTDVITLVNGDRITGEIVDLERGRLEFKTDNEGTIYVEWEKVVRVEAVRQFEVETSDLRRFIGTLGRPDDQSVLTVVGDQVVTLPIPEVTRITPIGASFWRKLDGSVDAGFTYTRSSGVAQATLNSETEYRRPAFLFDLTASATLTYQEDQDDRRSSQAAIDFSYERYAGRRWYLAGGGRVETNESLGLELRTQATGLVGLRLVNTNRAQFQTGAGLVGNNEKGVDTDSTQNIEGLLGLKGSYYSYDRPKTNFDVSLQYYPSLSSWGRQRVQFDTSISRELLGDFTVGLNAYDTFDSDPPNPDAAHNDVGIVASIGWSYGR